MAMHDGHRNRMRERYFREGLTGFADHEVLEMLMFSARSRGNLNPLAHDLLTAFGSLKGVLEATPEQLRAVAGVGEETAATISLIVPLFRRYEESLCAKQVFLASHDEARRYCRTLLLGLRSERFYVISLSSAMQVLGRRMVGDGSLTEVRAYPRLVVETALNHNASSVLLCHNHPGGIAFPSTDDVDVTCRLYAVLRQLSIRLLDHIIVTDQSVYSMRASAVGPFAIPYAKRLAQEEGDFID